jgi:hypothetical protein
MPDATTPTLRTATACAAHAAATLLFVLALALPAFAETLSGVGVKLEEGSIVPAAASVLANSSETLRLERGLLGQLGAGRSSGASGGGTHRRRAARARTRHGPSLGSGPLGAAGLGAFAPCLC